MGSSPKSSGWDILPTENAGSSCVRAGGADPARAIAPQPPGIPPGPHDPQRCDARARPHHGHRPAWAGHVLPGDRPRTYISTYRQLWRWWPSILTGGPGHPRFRLFRRGARRAFMRIADMMISFPGMVARHLAWREPSWGGAAGAIIAIAAWSDQIRAWLMALTLKSAEDLWRRRPNCTSSAHRPAHIIMALHTAECCDDGLSHPPPPTIGGAVSPSSRGFPSWDSAAIASEWGC